MYFQGIMSVGPSLDVTDDEGVGDATFIGRSEELKLLWSKWRDYRIFGVFGTRSVGKSRLVQEFENQYLDKSHYTCITIDCRYKVDLQYLYSNLCLKLGLTQDPQELESGQWIARIVDSIYDNDNQNYAFVFDNTEDFQDDPSHIRDVFLSLVTGIAKKCRNTKIFITSTTRLQFAQLHKVYYNHEVLPLKDADALELLLSELKGSDIDLGKCSKPIVSLTEGLPLLILMVASELKEDVGMITPVDMVELLTKSRLKTLSREFYPEEDRVGT